MRLNPERRRAASRKAAPIKKPVGTRLSKHKLKATPKVALTREQASALASRKVRSRRTATKPLAPRQRRASQRPKLEPSSTELVAFTDESIRRFRVSTTARPMSTDPLARSG